MSELRVQRTTTLPELLSDSLERCHRHPQHVHRWFTFLVDVGHASPPLPPITSRTALRTSSFLPLYSCAHEHRSFSSPFGCTGFGIRLTRSIIAHISTCNTHIPISSKPEDLDDGWKAPLVLLRDRLGREWAFNGSFTQSHSPGVQMALSGSTLTICDDADSFSTAASSSFFRLRFPHLFFTRHSVPWRFLPM